MYGYVEYKIICREERQIMKTHVNIYIDANAYLQARSNGINMSKLFNDYLLSYLEGENLVNVRVINAKQEIMKLQERKEKLEEEIVQAISQERRKAEAMQNKLKKGRQDLAAIKASGIIGAK